MSKQRPACWIIKVGAAYVADAGDAVLARAQRSTERFSDKGAAILGTIGLAGARVVRLVPKCKAVSP